MLRIGRSRSGGPSRGQRGAQNFARYHQLHAPILLASRGGRVIRHRHGLAEALAVTLAAGTPCATRKSRTALARFSESFMLYSSPPTLSVWPSTAIFSPGCPRMMPETLASFSRAPGFKV